MHTKETENLPELVERTALRRLNEEEMRNKAMQVISGTWDKFFTFILIFFCSLVGGIVGSKLRSSGLPISEFEGSVLSGLCGGVPAIIGILIMHQRKLDAVIQILQLNAKVET